MRDYIMIEDFRVWKSEYDNYENTYQLNKLHADGMCAEFSMWLNKHDISEDTFEDVYNNTSALRDGCRLDIHENYILTEDGRYEISYLWALENGIVYAAILDKEKDKFIGDIEICW